MRVLYILILLGLISCDPVKRHNRLVERYPYVHQDSTTTRIDTELIKIPPIRIRKSIPFSQLSAPYTVYKNRLKVEVQKVGDTLYLDAECADTVIKVKMKTITRTIHSPLPKCPEPFNWWKWGVIVAAGFIIFRMAFGRLR
jgi:hypothetical protein